MNYNEGVYYFSLADVWSPWTALFLWMPKKIKGKWYWFQTVYYRWNNIPLSSTQWAVDLFEIIIDDETVKF